MKDDMVQRHVTGRQTLREIAEEHGCSREYVRLMLNERGVSNLTMQRQSRRVEIRRLMRAVSYAAWRTANEDRHGQYARYLMGCRCEDCKTGNREYHRSLSGQPAPNHGTASAYRNYGCRCDPCKAAGVIDNKACRDRKKARELGLA